MNGDFFPEGFVEVFGNVFFCIKAEPLLQFKAQAQLDVSDFPTKFFEVFKMRLAF